MEVDSTTPLEDNGITTKTPPGLSGGKQTVRKRRSVSNPIHLRPCEVCGAKSSGIHFGAITCEACKVRIILLFFLLHVYFLLAIHIV